MGISAVLALGAGLGAGAALDRSTQLDPVATTELVSADLTAPAAPSVGRATARPDASTARLAADPVRTPAPAPTLPAMPAAPVPIDPLVLDASGLTFADREAGLLAPGVPPSAGGTLVVVPGTEVAPAPERPVKTVRVEVEAGLAIDGALFARTVLATLNDPRSWGGDGSMTFARTDGPADVVVALASPDLVDDLCAPLDTVGLFSCANGGVAVLNHLRWVNGAKDFTDLTQYRQYLVNHEVGHVLGHGHRRCPGAGRLAPLMQQQTGGVGACVPNAWPRATG